MLEWLFGNKKRILELINALRRETKKELEDVKKLDETFDTWERTWHEISEIIGEEKVEKRLGHILLNEFKKDEHEFRKKSVELTQQLRTNVLTIIERIEEIYLNIMELVDAVKQRNINKIKEEKEILEQQLNLLEVKLNDAEEIAESLEYKHEIISNLECTPNFRKKLGFFNIKNLNKIEKWLINLIGNPGWRRIKSDKMADTDLFSLPKRGESIRIIYKVVGNKIILYDIFSIHSDYEKIFHRIRNYENNINKYKGPYIPVFKPLADFAKS